MSGINNLFVGDENAEAFFIGGEECEVIYLGSEIVYQKGEIEGIRMKENVKIGMESGSTYGLKITSSEAWTLTVSSGATWLNFSRLSGGTGETIVTITTNEENQTGMNRATTITATTANYSATCVVTQISIHYVAFIHTDPLTARTNVYIDTGVFPTSATTMRVKYVGKNMMSSSKYFGFSWSGEEDKYNTAPQNGYRMFYANNHIYWDYNQSRVENNNVNPAQDGVFYDYTLGNNYIYDNLTETTIGSGATQGDPYPNIPIMANISCIWLQSIEIWENNTLLFNGHAAVDDANNIIGLYDSVSNDWYYNSAVTMTYEDNIPLVNWSHSGNVYTAYILPNSTLISDLLVCIVRATEVYRNNNMTCYYYFPVYLTTQNKVQVRVKSGSYVIINPDLSIGETGELRRDTIRGSYITNDMSNRMIEFELNNTTNSATTVTWDFSYTIQ